MLHTRHHPLGTLTAVGIIALSLTGCGRIAEKASEKAIEKAIESESGDDVDIDFSDGEFTIESEEGDITFSADENGVNIDGTDADGNDFTLDGDENGINIESADGNTSLDINDDGRFTVTDENGDVVTGGVDVDGETISIDGETGESVFSSAPGIPKEWPADVPKPEGLSEVTGTYFSDGDNVSIVVTGRASGSAKNLLDAYAGRLSDAGFAEDSKYTASGVATGSFTKGERRIDVSVTDSDDGSDMFVSVG